jgi:TolB protein
MPPALFVLLAAVLAAGLLGPTGPALAASSGENGKMALEDGYRIYTEDPDGSSRTLLTGGSEPAWSPDGARIAFSDTGYDESGASSTAGVYIVNADGTGRTRLSSDSARSDSHPVWSPDGTRVAFVGTYLECSDLHCHPASRKIYVAQADGSEQTPVAEGRVMDDDLAWSPDGTRIAFATDRNGDNGLYEYEIYVMGADGSGQTLLTTSNFLPDLTWAPDGTRIAFSSSEDGDDDVFVINADGTGRTRLTTNSGVDDYEPTWSPDGTKIAFIRNFRDGRGGDAVYAVNPDGGGEATKLSEGGYSDLDWGTAPLTPAPEPPNTTITSGPEEGSTTARGSATFRFASDQEDSTFECSLDGATFARCASPQSYDGLSSRAHGLKVRAVDRSGNADPTPAARVWTVDSIRPVVRAVSPRPGAQVRHRRPTISATVRDSQTNLSKHNVAMRVDGRRVTTFGYDRATDRLTYTARLAPGPHRVTLTARDAAGNVTTHRWDFRVVR